jgi:hypothetical protein
MGMASLFYVISVTLTEFCYLYADLDSIIAFSFLSVAFDVLFPLIFYSEVPSLRTALSSIVILLGLLVLALTFGWSTSKASARVQILLQFLLGLSVSMSRISFRKMSEVVATFENLTASFLSMWIHICGLLPLILAFLLYELPSIPTAVSLFNWDFATLVIFGVVTVELATVSLEFFKSCPGYGFVEDFLPLNCLPVFLLSFKWYHQTQYSVGQACGIALIVAGYVGSSLVRERKQREVSVDPEADFISLLGEDVVADELE